jgi:hypothetical protein
MNFDFTTLQQTLVKRGKEEPSVRPVLQVTFYSDQSLGNIGPAAAKALRRYLDLVPNNVLRSAQLDNGDAGKLTKQRVARDLRQLEQPPRNADTVGLFYSAGELGPPADYNVYYDLEDLTQPEFASDSALLKFDFPVSLADSPEEAVTTVSALAQELPFSTGVAGFAFSHWYGDSYAFDQILRFLPRYAGFDHSSRRGYEWIKGRTPSPSWVTFLRADLMEQLGGAAVLKSHAPEAPVISLANGCAILASRRPAVGDVNQGAPDLGELPGVARFLKPLRTKIPFMRGSQVELDVDTWLARFDDRANGPWDNG